MTTSTPRTEARPPGLLISPRGRAGGFTLVEVIIATTLGSFVLAGVLSAFLFLAKTSFRSSGYSEVDAQLRRGLDTFARDARSATDVRWNSAQSVTLTVNGQPVTYAYDATPASATYQSFYRVAGDATSTSPRTALIRGVATDFAFRRYKLEQSGVSDNAAQNDSETKLLQLSLRASRTNVATVGAGNSAVSARFMLRNKRVAN